MEWIVLLSLFPLGALAGFLTWHMHPWRLVRARRVVVNLRSGQAVDGLLVRQAGPLLFIAEGQLMEGNSSPIPLDGQAVIERQNIDFIQVL